MWLMGKPNRGVTIPPENPSKVLSENPPEATPEVTQPSELEEYISREENKCKENLKNLMHRLQDFDTWLIHDEINLTVTQEKLHLLREIKSICIKLNYIKD